MSKKVNTFQMHVVLAGVEAVLRETADNIAAVRAARHPYESYSGETPVRYQLNMAKAAVKLGHKFLRQHNEEEDLEPEKASMPARCYCSSQDIVGCGLGDCIVQSSDDE